MIWAASRYDKTLSHTTQEFLEDLSRIKYVKKLLTRYAITGELKYRLIINHLMVLINVFGGENTTKMIWLKMPNHLSYIKPFLVYLGILSDFIELNGQNIDTRLIVMDNTVIEKLRSK